MSELYHVSLPAARICTVCKIEKPLTEFSKSNKGPFGVRARCRVCINEQEGIRRKQKAALRPVPPKFVPTTTKKCKKCDIMKPLDAFDQSRWTCKDCRKTIERTRHFLKKSRKLVQLSLFPTSKKCTKCKTEKTLELFSQGNPYTLDGYSFRCRKCQKDDARERALKIVEVPESKVCGKCKIDKPLDLFPVSTGYGKYGRSSVCYDCAAKRYQENKEKYMATGALWKKNNRLKDRKRSQGYAARKKKASQIDTVDYARILERDGYWCHICEKDILPQDKMHFDHVIPLKRGGAHSEENLKPAHGRCNCRKHDKFLEEMTPYQRRGIR